MALNQFRATYDTALVLKDTGAVTADAAATVSSVAQILDLGTGKVTGVVKVYVSALDVASGDELYTILVQGSSSSSFASSNVNLVSKRFGDSSVTLASSDSVVGEYEIPFTNEDNGTLYRYLRLYTDVAGTTPSITYRAHAVVHA
jgi:hypothetical protein